VSIIALFLVAFFELCEVSRSKIKAKRFMYEILCIVYSRNIQYGKITVQNYTIFL